MSFVLKKNKLKTRITMNLKFDWIVTLAFLSITWLMFFQNKLTRYNTTYIICVSLFAILNLAVKEYLFKQETEFISRLFWLIDLLNVIAVSLFYSFGFFPINFLLPLYLFLIYLSTIEAFPREILYITILSMVGFSINVFFLWEDSLIFLQKLGYSTLTINLSGFLALFVLLFSGFLATTYAKIDSSMTRNLEEMLLEKEEALNQTHLTRTKLEEKYAFFYTLTLIQQFLFQELDETKLFANTTDIIQGILGSSICAIFGIGEDKQIELLAYSGKELCPTITNIVNNKDSLVAKTIETKSIHNEQAASQEEMEYWRKQGINYISTVPLSSKGGILGVMLAANFQKVFFNQEQHEQLLIIANQLSLALENTKLHQETKKMAMHDSLTNLYNRNYMNVFLSVVQDNSKLASAMFDLDRFKIINDTYGHITGDLVLQKLATTLKKYSTTRTIAVRYGGEEFLLLSLEHNLEEMFAIAEEIRKEIANTTFLSTNGKEFSLTISCGIARIPEHTLMIEDLVAKADEALYKAKNSGRNQVQIYSE